MYVISSLSTIVFITIPQIICAPLIFFPLVLAGLTDALIALNQIADFLIADELAEPLTIDEREENTIAIDVNGSFVWETAGKPIEKEANVKKNFSKKGQWEEGSFTYYG